MISHFGVNIRRRRESKGLSRAELAAKADVTERSIYRYEKLQDHLSVRSDELTRVAKALDVTLDALVYPCQDDNEMQDDILESRHIYSFPALANSLYRKIMAAETIDNCKDIADDVLAKESYLSAFLFGLIDPDVAKERQSEYLCDKLNQFWGVAHVYAAIVRASKHSDNQDMVAQAFAEGEAHGAGPTYMLDPLDTGAHTHNDLTTIHYCAAINQYVCIHSYDLEDYTMYGIDDPDGNMTREDIIAEFLRGGIYTTIAHYASDYIERFILPKLDNIVSLKDGRVCYRCSKILPALYQMLLLCPSDSE